MDLQESNSRSEDFGNKTEVPFETKQDKNHTNTSNYLSESLEKRIEKYKVDDTNHQCHPSPSKQAPAEKKSRTFHNICLGPGAYDNLTFKDDNEQFDLKKFVINGQSKTSSKSKAVHHKSYENLLLKNSGENPGGNTTHVYERIRKGNPTDSRSSTPPTVPVKTTNSPQTNGIANPDSKAPSGTSGLVPDTPQTTVQIPADGNIQSFSADDMVVFFRCLKIDELIIQRLKRKKLDGKKFSRLRDIDLEEIGIKNPIVCYFRDRSKKQRIPFML